MIAVNSVKEIIGFDPRNRVCSVRHMQIFNVGVIHSYHWDLNRTGIAQLV